MVDKGKKIYNLDTQSFTNGRHGIIIQLITFVASLIIYVLFFYFIKMAYQNGEIDDVGIMIIMLFFLTLSNIFLPFSADRIYENGIDLPISALSLDCLLKRTFIKYEDIYLIIETLTPDSRCLFIYDRNHKSRMEICSDRFRNKKDYYVLKEALKKNCKNAVWKEAVWKESQETENDL